MKRKLSIIVLVAGVALVAGCRRQPSDGTAPKHHAPRPEVTTTRVSSAPQPGMQSAQQPAPRQ